MYNLNNIGHARPLCNSRQFATTAAFNMKLQPEYEPLKFLNDFGLPREKIVRDKQFVDINNRLNHQLSCDTVKPKPAQPPMYDTIKTPMPDKLSGTCKERMAVSEPTSQLPSPANHNIKIPKKAKQSKMPRERSPKQGKKSKKRRQHQKQSKRETDRCVIAPNAARRRRSKRSDKKPVDLKVEDVDECDFYSSPKQQQQPLHLEPFFILAEVEVCQPEPVPVIQCFRSKLPSECESEDSFIVFDQGSELDDADELLAFDLSCDENSEDSDSDVEFCVTRMQNGCDIRTSVPQKKVRFATGKDLCKVHPMIQWSFAYQKARKGPWEQHALDRMRFRNRITSLEPALNEVLQPAHRSKIYRERFLQSSD